MALVLSSKFLIHVLLTEVLSHLKRFVSLSRRENFLGIGLVILRLGELRFWFGVNLGETTSHVRLEIGLGESLVRVVVLRCLVSLKVLLLLGLVYVIMLLDRRDISLKILLGKSILDRLKFRLDWNVISPIHRVLIQCRITEGGGRIIGLGRAYLSFPQSLSRLVGGLT